MKLIESDVPSSVLHFIKANVPSLSSQIMPLFPLLELLLPSPRVKINPRSFAGSSVKPSPSLIRESLIVVLLEVIVAPVTLRSPLILTVAS